MAQDSQSTQTLVGPAAFTSSVRAKVYECLSAVYGVRTAHEYQPQNESGVERVQILAMRLHCWYSAWQAISKTGVADDLKPSQASIGLPLLDWARACRTLDQIIHTCTQSSRTTAPADDTTGNKAEYDNEPTTSIHEHASSVFFAPKTAPGEWSYLIVRSQEDLNDLVEDIVNHFTRLFKIAAPPAEYLLPRYQANLQGMDDDTLEVIKHNSSKRTDPALQHVLGTSGGSGRKVVMAKEGHSYRSVDVDGTDAKFGNYLSQKSASESKQGASHSYNGIKVRGGKARFGDHHADSG